MKPWFFLLGSLPLLALGSPLVVDVPSDIRQWYRNPDGSCVQCSIGICGVDQNVPEAATLLWETEYGPAERGGSYPSRVAEFEMPKGAEAIEAGMKVYWVETSGQVTTEDFPDYSDSTPTSSGAYSSSGDGSGSTLAMNVYLGKTVADAEVDDATVRVRLSQ